MSPHQYQISTGPLKRIGLHYTPSAKQNRADVTERPKVIVKIDKIYAACEGWAKVWRVRRQSHHPCSAGFDQASASDLATKMLTLWQADSELAGLRESDALNKLPAEEREKWIALWKHVADVLARMH